MTPALTVPQLRVLIGWLLLRSVGATDEDAICRNATRRLQRIEAARLYHYKKVQKLAPLRLVRRE
jgi:hypothetical protein